MASTTEMDLRGTGIGPTMLVGRVESARPLPDGGCEIRVAYLRHDAAGRPTRAHARIRPEGTWEEVHAGDVIVARGTVEAADGALRMPVTADRAAIIHAHGDGPDDAILKALPEAIRKVTRR